MISLLRKTRARLMQKNRISNYLAYSLGEIALVVIGILLALAINNLNTDRIENKYLTEAYKDIYMDLRIDMNLILGGVEPRLNNAEKGIQGLLYNIHNNRYDSTDAYFYQIHQRFSLTANKGAYESLKDKGIEVIKDSEMRFALFNFYEMMIPRSIHFIHGGDDVLFEKLAEIENSITVLNSEVNQEGRIWIHSQVKGKEVLQSQELKRIVRLIDYDLVEKRVRLENLKESYIEIINSLEKELDRRGVTYKPFTENVVELDF